MYCTLRKSGACSRPALGQPNPGPGKKLGILAADVRYLVRRGYPVFPPATQEDLAIVAFVSGLTPTALLAAPASLELTVAHGERVKAVLEEGEHDWEEYQFAAPATRTHHCGQLDHRTGILHIRGGPALALALANPRGPAFPRRPSSRDPFVRQLQALLRAQRSTGDLSHSPPPGSNKHQTASSIIHQRCQGQSSPSMAPTKQGASSCTTATLSKPQGDLSFPLGCSTNGVGNLSHCLKKACDLSAPCPRDGVLDLE
ncbi:UNVERIFIED_CONTAM: hypothetical protein FKN15_068040 [Acipenser sinensis]